MTFFKRYGILSLFFMFNLWKIPLCNAAETTPLRNVISQEKRSELFLKAEALKYYEKAPWHPESWWVNAGTGGTLYEARLNVVMAHATFILTGGWRGPYWGYFMLLEQNAFWDFSIKIERLDITKVGFGVERILFMGHSRWWATYGMTILASDTDIDSAGSLGWFVGLCPFTYRWDMGRSQTLEFTPLSFNLQNPIVDTIPLFLTTFTTTISYEFGDLL